LINRVVVVGRGCSIMGAAVYYGIGLAKERCAACWHSAF